MPKSKKSNPRSKRPTKERDSREFGRTSSKTRFSLKTSLHGTVNYARSRAGYLLRTASKIRENALARGRKYLIGYLAAKKNFKML